jgi:ABC-type dipeptide/oligopeptide/nickel transport system permease subunit
MSEPGIREAVDGMVSPESTLAPIVPPEGGDVPVVSSGWKLALSEFAQNRLALVAVLVIVLFILFCFVGPLVHHTNQTVFNPLQTDLPPGPGHPLGTDQHGFDELGQLMKGGQTALEIGFFASVIATVIGTLFGAVAGLVGGLLDGAMMRFVDVLLSIPILFIVLIVATKYNGTIWTLSLILGLFTWLVPARLVRGEVLTLRVRDFVSAAKVAGSGWMRLINRHLMPNALGVIIVTATFAVADAILAVATLGFLGFGLQFPTFDWGDMLNNGMTYLQDGYWWQVYPVGICIIVVVMACNLIGDALRDALDVRLRRR